jgi:acylphosphatase
MLIDSGDGMNIRGTFTVEGIVQGVGYREFVRNKAYELNIKGYVRNLKKNEAVEVVCEGEEAVVRQFPGLIDTRTDRIIVEKITQRYTKPTGRFERFSIRRDLTKEGTLEILEKLDTGFQMIKDLDYHITGKQGETLGKQDIMIGKQDIMIGKQDLMLGKQDETVKAIKEVGADVKAVSADVKAMDSNMSGRFDRLDAKYGQFGKTMKSVQKDTKGMASHMKRMNTGIKSVASDIKVIRKEATRGRKKPAPG